ncbi:hypothetical protein BDZ94DRAFT_1305909 [Collybia nuda]|uniref:Uncharacterized protein n=1 Tax=Collybia nuda TaxID=64659 RepID=A0A9P5YB26_9AGAR|nr:hypothetical protein BDZ94DRAFT_1305909 [Collybia nuda]
MRGTTALDARANSYGTPSEKQVNDQVHDTRPCNQCTRGRIPVADTKKSCKTCRDKRRNYNQTKKRKLSALATIQEPNSSTNTLSVSAAPSAKRKVDEAFKDAEGREEDISKVLERMKKRLIKQIYEPGTSNTSASSTKVKNQDPNYIEFQTATDMYRALKSQSKSKAFHFHGSFSIIAVSSVDNSKRERLVTQELRKIAKLSFEYDKPKLLGSVLVYNCACTNYSQLLRPQPRTSPLNTMVGGEPAPRKHRPSDLAVSVGLDSGGTNLSPVVCTGKILVSSEDDHSHPMGIRGQKITVRVEH